MVLRYKHIYLTSPYYLILRKSNSISSYAKIVQGERREASLFAVYAEPQPILCKDSANRMQKTKLA